MGSGCLDAKIGVISKIFEGCKCMIQALELYGCIFPGSLLLIRTMTNGNALCSLINFYIAAHHVDKILQGSISTFM